MITNPSYTDGFQQAKMNNLLEYQPSNQDTAQDQPLAIEQDSLQEDEQAITQNGGFFVTSAPDDVQKSPMQATSYSMPVTNTTPVQPPKEKK